MTSAPEAIRSQILNLVKEYHTAKFAPKTFDPDKDLVHYFVRALCRELDDGEAEVIVLAVERKASLQTSPNLISLTFFYWTLSIVVTY